MRRTRGLVVALAVAWGPSGLLGGSGAPSEAALEVEKGVKAYNAQDLQYYEAHLAPDAVYIADDGATFVGKERVMALFGRIFGGTPAPQLTVTDVVTGGSGDVAWARFKWTRTKGPDSRQGIASAIFLRAGGEWTVVLIQNTPAGHAMPGAPARH